MHPLLALLAFAGQDFSVAAPPPAAPHVFDFRLAGGNGAQRAITDMNLIARDQETGALVARVYWVELSGDPLLLVADITVDCGTRRFSWGYTAAFDSAFRPLANQIRPFGSNETPAAGSTADQTVSFVCAGRAVQSQQPYLGSEWKSAVRVVDPRFR
jgi:hypothetical protein